MKAVYRAAVALWALSWSLPVGVLSPGLAGVVRLVLCGLALWACLARVRRLAVWAPLPGCSCGWCVDARR
jgi:hypothetical protein